MKSYEVDMGGVGFATRFGLKGFITRGALQDLTDLPYGHRWGDQEPAFLARSPEIEAFAHGLADRGALIDGQALINPCHVCSWAEPWTQNSAD